MFAYFKRFFTKSSNQWKVKIERDLITLSEASKINRKIQLEDITAIVIETNDKGPAKDDVWWILYGKEEEPFRFPMGIVGEDKVVDRLLKFPQFNFAAMTDAMTSTKNALFTLWEKGWVH